MSVGNVSQAISFTDDELVLVLGENLDLGGNDSRNGVGKSTLVNALSYALYGTALTNIKRDNLINKINSKTMMVTLDYEKDGIQYRIERGRKPGVFKYVVNGKEYGDEYNDEAQGDNRDTQKVVERDLGITHELFKHLVALNTYTLPFLAQRSNDQRTIIEELLGITKLSEKAEVLRQQLKTVRDEIKEEEFRIKAVTESNKKIEKNIASIKIKSKTWEKSKEEKITTIHGSLESLIDLDINEEIDAHKFNEVVNSSQRAYNTKQQDISSIEKEVKIYQKNLTSAEKNLSMTRDTNLCPTCSQDMDHDTHEKVHSEFEKQARDATAKIKEKQIKIDEKTQELNNITVDKLKKTYYNDVESAYNHKTTVDTLANELERQMELENPYLDQIQTLESDGLQEIDFEIMNELVSFKDHQEFLLKLLTNKDSFIRKKIIDQNLLYLNSRLSYYLEKMGLPHQVKFKSDLEVEISTLGKDYDFDNLSRGERTRLILSLSWAFRDVFESLNDRINLLFIDELIDSGLDTQGVESSLSVLKKMTREGKRNVFLISHRDELIGRVTSVLKVIKEGGFTSFDVSDTNLI